MTLYALYLESGPRRRKTMVHVPELLGCVAVGPTTDEALAATPDAISAYRRFLRRHGETIEVDAPIETKVAEHVTEGMWLGNGSPYVAFGSDLIPLTDAEIEICLGRCRALSEELAAWAEGLSGRQLDAAPKDGGRPARAVLMHVLATPGVYLATALGSAPGFYALRSAVERKELALPEALRRVAAMTAERVRAATPEERVATCAGKRPGEESTLTKALRRTLEHHWEHLAELSRRAGGPRL